MAEEQEQEKKTYDARDALTGVILGVFFILMSLPVLAGTFFAEKAIDRGINIVSGLIILVIGAAFLARGTYIHRKSRTRWTD